MQVFILIIFLKYYCSTECLIDYIFNSRMCQLKLPLSLKKRTMRFTAFLEIQLNPGTRDIEDIGDIGDLRDCLWAKPTNCAAITSTQTGHLSRC